MVAHDPEASSKAFQWQVRNYFGVLIFEPVCAKDPG